MKKILTLTLIASLIAPSLAIAAVAPPSGGEYQQPIDNPTAPGGTPLFDNSFGQPAFSEGVRSDAEVATEMAAQQTADCAKGETGGSLSQGLLGGLFNGAGGLGGGSGQCTGGDLFGGLLGGGTQYKNGDVVLAGGQKWCYQKCPQGVICEINDGWNICTNQSLPVTVSSTSQGGSNNCSTGGGGGIMGILNAIQGGDWGSILQQLGRSGLGQQLLSQLGEPGKILSQVLGGDITGALNSLGLGNLLGGGGLGGLLGGGGLGGLLGGGGGLGGLLGGGAGGLLGGLGGLAGGLGGGAVVPVLDQKALEQLIKQLVEQTGIHKDSSTLVHKECVIDPMLRQFSNQIGQQTSSSYLEHVATGNGGEPMYSTDYNGDRNRRADASFKAFVAGPTTQALCQPFQQKISSLAQEAYETYRSDTTRQIQCTNDNAAAFMDGQYPTGDPVAEIYDNFVVNPQNTFSYAYITYVGLAGQAVKAGQEELDHALEMGRRFYGEFTCPDGSEATTYADCPSPTIVTPGSLVQEGTSFAHQAGERRNEQAHEVGEMIDPLLSQLFNKLLSFGIKELTKKSTSGQGSYLEQLSGNAQDNSTASAKNFVSTNIATALAVEQQYQVIKQNLIAKLQQLIGTYSEINACYVAVSKKSPTGITIAEATQKANTASTTIALAFRPQIAQHTADLDESDEVAAQLIALGTAISQAQSTDDINAIATAYDSLATSGVIHTSADITFLSTESNISQLALQSLLDQGTIELALCKTY